MNLHKKWMTNNSLYGDDYYRNAQLQSIKKRFDLQRYKSNDGCTVTINGIEERVLIQGYANPLDEKRENRKLLAPLETNISRGYYVVWENENWIITTDIDRENGVYTVSEIAKCTNILKWIDSNGNIQQAPCILSILTKISDGLDKGELLTILDTKKSLVVSNNNFTKDLQEGQRLLFNHNKRYCFEISQIDGLTDPGLLNITLIHNEYNASTDDLENNLCNVNNLASYSLQILSTNPLSINTGNTVNLQVELKNNGVLVTDDNILSQITYSSDNTNVATIDNNGLITGVSVGNCNVSVKYGDIVTSVSVNVSNIVLDSYSITLSTNTGVDYVKQTRSIIINANILNNGVTDSNKSVIWNVINKDNSTPCLVTTSNSTSTNITLVAGQILGYIIVRATLNTDSNVYVEKEILVKSIMA